MFFNKEQWDYVLNESWPAHIAKGLFGAATLPGDVYAGRVDPMSDEGIGRAADLAGMLTMGPVAGPAGVLGSGAVRQPLRDNYRTPLRQYTERLWREESPEDALMSIPGSNVSGSFGPAGAPSKYYADSPDLALGQGANRGVRMEYDSSPFEGKVNTAKPMWEKLWGDGVAEYVASPAPGSDVRAAVRAIDIDKAALDQAGRAVKAQYGHVVQRLQQMGWQVSDDGGRMRLVAPDPESAERVGEVLRAGGIPDLSAMLESIETDED
jgi:hypothetical protein